MGLSSTVAWGLGEITYALEGNISAAPARRSSGSASSSSAEDPAQPRGGPRSQGWSDTAGVYLVPAFRGLGRASLG